MDPPVEEVDEQLLQAIDAAESQALAELAQRRSASQQPQQPVTRAAQAPAAAAAVYMSQQQEDADDGFDDKFVEEFDKVMEEVQTQRSAAAANASSSQPQPQPHSQSQASASTPTKKRRIDTSLLSPAQGSTTPTPPPPTATPPRAQINTPTPSTTPLRRSTRRSSKVASTPQNTPPAMPTPQPAAGPSQPLSAASLSQQDPVVGPSQSTPTVHPSPRGPAAHEAMPGAVGDGNETVLAEAATTPVQSQPSKSTKRKVATATAGMREQNQGLSQGRTQSEVAGEEDTTISTPAAVPGIVTRSRAATESVQVVDVSTTPAGSGRKTKQSKKKMSQEQPSQDLSTPVTSQDVPPPVASQVITTPVGSIIPPVGFEQLPPDSMDYTLPMPPQFSSHLKPGKKALKAPATNTTLARATRRKTTGMNAGPSAGQVHDLTGGDENSSGVDISQQVQAPKPVQHTEDADDAGRLVDGGDALVSCGADAGDRHDAAVHPPSQPGSKEAGSTQLPSGTQQIGSTQVGSTGHAAADESAADVGTAEGMSQRESSDAVVTGATRSRSKKASAKKQKHEETLVSPAAGSGKKKSNQRDVAAVANAPAGVATTGDDDVGIHDVEGTTGGSAALPDTGFRASKELESDDVGIKDVSPSGTQGVMADTDMGGVSPSGTQPIVGDADMEGVVTPVAAGTGKKKMLSRSAPAGGKKVRAKVSSGSERRTVDATKGVDVVDGSQGEDGEAGGEAAPRSAPEPGQQKKKQLRRTAAKVTKGRVLNVGEVGGDINRMAEQDEGKGGQLEEEEVEVLSASKKARSGKKDVGETGKVAPQENRQEEEEVEVLTVTKKTRSGKRGVIVADMGAGERDGVSGMEVDNVNDVMPIGDGDGLHAGSVTPEVKATDVMVVDEEKEEDVGKSKKASRSKKANVLSTPSAGGAVTPEQAAKEEDVQTGKKGNSSRKANAVGTPVAAATPEVAKEEGVKIAKKGNSSRKVNVVGTPVDAATPEVAKEEDVKTAKKGNSSRKANVVGTPVAAATPEQAAKEEDIQTGKKGNSSRKATVVGTPVDAATPEQAAKEEDIKTGKKGNSKKKAEAQQTPSILLSATSERFRNIFHNELFGVDSTDEENTTGVREQDTPAPSVTHHSTPTSQKQASKKVAAVEGADVSSTGQQAAEVQGYSEGHPMVKPKTGVSMLKKNRVGHVLGSTNGGPPADAASHSSDSSDEESEEGGFVGRRAGFTGGWREMSRGAHAACDESDDEDDEEEEEDLLGKLAEGIRMAIQGQGGELQQGGAGSLRAVAKHKDVAAGSNGDLSGRAVEGIEGEEEEEEEEEDDDDLENMKAWEPQLELKAGAMLAYRSKQAVGGDANKEKGLAKQLLAPPRDEVRAGREAVKQAPKTAGSNWYNLPATAITDEVKQELRLLHLRGAYDPKHFYKRMDSSKFPKYFQMGTVKDTATDFYGGRLTNADRKATLADELLADESVTYYRKKRARAHQAQAQPKQKYRKTDMPREKKQKKHTTH